MVCQSSGSLLASGQNHPLKVEVKEFKTSDFLEQNAAPLGRLDAGPMEHIERPQVSDSTELVEGLQTTIYRLHDRGWSWRRIARELVSTLPIGYGIPGGNFLVKLEPKRD
jgi:hypothetical protein